MRAQELIPPPLRPPARAVFHRLYRGALRLRCWTLDRLPARPPAEGHPLPPAMLRFRVDEDPGAQLFYDSGRKLARDVQAALEAAGRPLAGFETVLDFGCGCGRVMAWLLREHPGVAFHGADVDGAAIAWCRVNLPAGGFAITPFLPPTGYPNAMFDLVVAISVFTHLDEPTQLVWLEELRRILKPGGVLLLSLHGERSRTHLAQEDFDALRERGFLFKTSTKLRGIVPEGYHTAYQSRAYAERTFGRFFDVLSYVEGGLGYQDLAILERTPPPACK